MKRAPPAEGLWTEQVIADSTAEDLWPGCACYSWACPSCRGETTGLIANVNNTVMLRGLLNASQGKLKDLREIHDLD